MPAWGEILDAEIQAYRPVTSRLMRRFRNNHQLARQIIFGGCQDTFGSQAIAEGSGNEDTYFTLTTFQVWVRPFAVDVNLGYDLRLRLLLEVTNNAQGINTIATFRFLIDGASSAETVINNSVNNTTATARRTITANVASPTTTDGLYTVSLQGKATLDELSPVGSTTIKARFDRQDRGYQWATQ